MRQDDLLEEEIAPKGLPSSMKARCPRHGLSPFHWLDIAGWWMCEGFGRQGDGTPQGAPGCFSVILEEDVTPDGADVTDYSEPYEHERERSG